LQENRNGREARWCVIGDARVGTAPTLGNASANSPAGLGGIVTVAELNDPEWSTWSSNKIAKQCVVDDKFVEKLKAEGHTSDIRSMDAAPAVGPPAAAAERTVTFTHPKTGKPTQMKTSNIGKRKKHLAVSS
jgi:hypothetical protein